MCVQIMLENNLQQEVRVYVLANAPNYSIIYIFFVEYRKTMGLISWKARAIILLDIYDINDTIKIYLKGGCLCLRKQYPEFYPCFSARRH